MYIFKMFNNPKNIKTINVNRYQRMINTESLSANTCEIINVHKWFISLIAQSRPMTNQVDWPMLCPNRVSNTKRSLYTEQI